MESMASNMRKERKKMRIRKGTQAKPYT